MIAVTIVAPFNVLRLLKLIASAGDSGIASLGSLSLIDYRWELITRQPLSLALLRSMAGYRVPGKINRRELMGYDYSISKWRLLPRGCELFANPFDTQRDVTRLTTRVR